MQEDAYTLIQLHNHLTSLSITVTTMLRLHQTPFYTVRFNKTLKNFTLSLFKNDRNDAITQKTGNFQSYKHEQECLKYSSQLSTTKAISALSRTCIIANTSVDNKTDNSSAIRILPTITHFLFRRKY